ncbi:MAG: hypothetical protein AABX95_04555 [Nanoarchaeota archaeon]
MNKQNLIGGLTFLVLTGCVANPESRMIKNLPSPESIMMKDVPYTESRNGYFIENGQKYFGKNGKRYFVRIDNTGIEKTAEVAMKFDGKSYYFDLGHGVLDDSN